MATKEEMNRVIAEGCGWKWNNSWDRGSIGYWSPDGNYWARNLPDFFHPRTGMGDLFEWAIPEVTKRYGYVQVVIDCDNTNYPIINLKSASGEHLGHGHGENVSTALATAVYRVFKEGK